jgi:superfamily II DNA or RNA helicase
MLIDEKIPDGITSGYENPVDQLFIPLLRQAETYDVAVGYFTSGWLRDTAEGFAEFALSGGKSRWVVSPSLNRNDAEIIIDTKGGLDESFDYRERRLFETIRALKEDARKELCSLIGSGVLEFRIAEPKKKGNAGMLHAKVGIATDASGDSLAFSGSYNLTSNAKFNWENIEIFRSWVSGEENRIKRNRNRFEALWENRDPSYETYAPSKELTKLIRKEAGTNLDEFILKRKDRLRTLPKFRDYQLEAIDNWGKNNGRGTFVMATGSGKTITALGTIQKLIENIVTKKEKPLIIVIVLPLKHLLDQWHKEATAFGLDSIKCYENSSTWTQKLAESLSTLSVTREGYIIALVTNATFAKGNFQNLLGKIDSDFLIVADEAHNLGSSSYLDALPANANFRLALSATPERHNDTFGTKRLFEYFGNAVITFSLEDAITEGFLCPYKYHMHVCPMSDEEYGEYLDISTLIRAESGKKREGVGKSKELLRLEGKRADLITRVESKLEILEKHLTLQKSNGGVTHTLVYCGSRKGEDSERHIERTVKLIGRTGVRVRKFTAGESVEERKEILNLFASGDLEAIAAIKCLDEGVDVPETRVAYILASTTNPREYIQRRGRVLRKAAGKEFAIIHDFLVCPPLNQYEETDLLNRELDRAREFSELALNRTDCLAEIEKLESTMEI